MTSMLSSFVVIYFIHSFIAFYICCCLLYPLFTIVVIVYFSVELAAQSHSTDNIQSEAMYTQVNKPQRGAPPQPDLYSSVHKEVRILGVIICMYSIRTKYLDKLKFVSQVTNGRDTYTTSNISP